MGEIRLLERREFFEEFGMITKEIIKSALDEIKEKEVISFKKYDVVIGYYPLDSEKMAEILFRYIIETAEESSEVSG